MEHSLDLQSLMALSRVWIHRRQPNPRRGIGFTFEDIPGDGMIGAVVADEPLLAFQETSFHGQPIAFIVAETVEAARDGAKACELEIEELPPITCPRKAFERAKSCKSLGFSKKDP